MNKELQELRSQNQQPRGPSAQPVQLSATPTSQLTDEDAVDDFHLDVSVVSLEGNFLDASTAVQAFQRYANRLVDSTHAHCHQLR